jgi:hypothetical protein
MENGKLPRRSGPRVFAFLLITTIQNDLVNSTYVLLSTLVFSCWLRALDYGRWLSLEFDVQTHHLDNPLDLLNTSTCKHFLFMSSLYHRFRY